MRHVELLDRQAVYRLNARYGGLIDLSTQHIRYRPTPCVYRGLLRNELHVRVASLKATFESNAFDLNGIVSNNQIDGVLRAINLALMFYVAINGNSSHARSKMLARLQRIRWGTRSEAWLHCL